MRLGQGVIQLHRLHGGRLCVLPDLLRRRVSGLAQKVIRIRQPGVRLGIVGIFFDRLIEIVGGFSEPVFRPLVPVKKALQIELVGFGVFGIVFGDLADLICANNPGAKVVVNFLRDVALNSNQVGNLAIELVTPKFSAIGHVHQIGLDQQSVSALRHPAHQHRVHVEFLADFLGVDFAPLVTEDRAASHHPQFRHAGKAADNSFGNSVGEILDVGVRAHIHERQNGDGMNVISAAQPTVAQALRKQHCNQQQEENCGGCDDRGFAPRGLRSLRRREGGNSGRLGVALDPFEVGLQLGGGLVA